MTTILTILDIIAHDAAAFVLIPTFILALALYFDWS